MIPFASQRAGGQDLAGHLQNEYDNEIVEIADLRGAIARDLHGAFKEWQVQAEVLTKCKEYLYSLSINPDPKQGPLSREQYLDYIGRVEKTLGFEGQPRAVVFHTKYGREHCHVVWSRILVEQEKAVHLFCDHEALMQLTRVFARDHNLKLPDGYYKSPKRGQESYYERELKRQSGLSKADHEAAIKYACEAADGPQAFKQALLERGYVLAAGDRRAFVVVDLYGGIHSLSRRLKDKAVKAGLMNDLTAEYPPGSLPSVEEAQDTVENRRATSENAHREWLEVNALAALRDFQAQRRERVASERSQLAQLHKAARFALEKEQACQRQAVRRANIESRKALRAAYVGGRARGLANFLGKVTGYSAVRKAIYRFRVGRLVDAQRFGYEKLLRSQQAINKANELRLLLQSRDMERKVRNLEALEKRERAALLRDNLRLFRESERVDFGGMPDLSDLMVDSRGSGALPERLLDYFDSFSTTIAVDSLSEIFAAVAEPQINGAEDDQSGAREPDGPDRGRSR
jgi:hypothetical protein